MKYNKYVLYTFLPILILFLCALFYFAGINRSNHYVKGQEFLKEITIENGSSVDDISKLLDANGLINSRALFKFYVYLNNKTLQAGIYTPRTNLNIKEIAALLGAGSFQKKLTFIEGLRIEQMAEILPVDIQKDFLESSYTKEGYMFPDTYFFKGNATGEDIAKTLRETFNQEVDALKGGIDNPNLTLDEVVTLASIVEREANNTNDRKIVAGILVKRYKNDWPLQADATIQYAKDSMSNTCYVSDTSCAWWKKLSAKDLAIETPYNTYKYKGLPPTPICNPGLDSIKAVLEPKETEYWFYLTDSAGITHYSITIEEHNENIRRYL